MLYMSKLSSFFSQICANIVKTFMVKFNSKAACHCVTLELWPYRQNSSKQGRQIGVCYVCKSVVSLCALLGCRLYPVHVFLKNPNKTDVLTAAGWTVNSML